MIQKVLIILGGLVLGAAVGYLFFSEASQGGSFISPPSIFTKKEVIGFLPYWLADKASPDYSKYITNLTYFGLTTDTDGHILKLSTPQEEEPGWHALKSGKIDPFLESAKKQNQELSLLIFDSNQDSIANLMNDPITHAQNLLSDVTPLMKQYSFSNLNLDIEYTKEASPDARLHFSQFTQTVKKGLDDSHSGTLTVDVSPTDLIKSDLIDPKAVSESADKVVLMTYDYHFTGSQVSGPVAPLSGAGTVSEFDIETAVEKALAIMPSSKIILGAPLYGYEWETVNNFPRAATIPGSGLIASSQRVAQLLSTCASCSAQLDGTAQEKYLVYKDQETGTYHQIFFPDQSSTQIKINYAKSLNLGGLAFWALGYEGPDILKPLESYK
jgi:spore germination protein